MTIGGLFALIFGAIIVDNFIFSQFLGICPFLGVSEKPSTALGMGAAVTFVMTLASAATYGLYYGILVPFHLEYLQTIGFILVIAVLVQFMEMLLKKQLPALYGTLGIYLPLITTNCAVLGAAIINIKNGHNFIESVLFGAAAAIGFTVAIVIFSGVRKRLALANPPKAFRGTPLALISAGLVAMAFLGFSGIKF